MSNWNQTAEIKLPVRIAWTVEAGLWCFWAWKAISVVVVATLKLEREPPAAREIQLISERDPEPKAEPKHSFSLYT